MAGIPMALENAHLDRLAGTDQPDPSPEDEIVSDYEWAMEVLRYFLSTGEMKTAHESPEAMFDYIEQAEDAYWNFQASRFCSHCGAKLRDNGYEVWCPDGGDECGEPVTVARYRYNGEMLDFTYGHTPAAMIQLLGLITRPGHKDDVVVTKEVIGPDWL